MDNKNNEGKSILTSLSDDDFKLIYEALDQRAYAVMGVNSELFLQLERLKIKIVERDNAISNDSQL